MTDPHVHEDHLTPNQRAWRRFLQHRVALVSALFLAAVLALLFVWPLLHHPRLAPFLPRALTHEAAHITDAQFAVPSSLHWCGTDVHGRDLLARLVSGTRISLLVGLFGAGVSLVIGVLWGALAGYLGGRWDSVMMRFVDVLYSLPSVIFVIVLITLLDAFLKSGRLPGLGASAQVVYLFAGLGAVSWLTMARIVRGEVLSLRTRAFVEASRVLGASHARILLRHILPNVAGVIIVYLTLTVPSIILYESFLSYLGLGIQPPQASLGSLIAEGAAQINPIRVYWWMIVLPAGTLATLLLALNFVGDGLRDALDPRADEG